MGSLHSLEDDVKDLCNNPDCRKPRQEEELESVFDGTNHYVTWECNECGDESWWETEQMTSGVDHIQS